MVQAEIKAYRIKGGAVVNVLRNGKKRRHVIGLRRFKQLRETLNIHRPTSGYLGSSTLDMSIHEVAGLADAATRDKQWDAKPVWWEN